MATNVVRTLLNSDASREREETWPELSDRLTSAAICAEAAPVVAMPAVSAVKVIAAWWTLGPIRRFFGEVVELLRSDAEAE